MLPELLDISSVRNAAASTILSNVNITDSVSRHENIYGDDNSYSKCKCVQFDIEPANLKRGVDQWVFTQQRYTLMVWNNFKIFSKISQKFCRMPGA